MPPARDEGGACAKEVRSLQNAKKKPFRWQREGALIRGSFQSDTFTMEKTLLPFPLVRMKTFYTGMPSPRLVEQNSSKLIIGGKLTS